MKILYLSCHSILEYDELRLFESLGYEYFSMGAYINPQQPHDIKRPALKGEYNDHLVSIATRYIKHKRVIWRSIGQSVRGIEERLKPYVEQGLEIVRYSPAERNIPSYAGENAIIRFYKDPAEFGGWNGSVKQVMTVGQSMRKRGSFCNYNLFHEVTGGEAALYGSDNEDCPEWKGQLGYEELKQAMRDHRVFFYTGTHPASYTLGFMEAFMTGIPIVSIGHQYGNSPAFGQRTFEVPEIIQNGHNGFVSDDPEQLTKYINKLLNDDALAADISANARRTAVELFGMKAIGEQWRNYLEGNK